LPGVKTLSGLTATAGSVLDPLSRNWRQTSLRAAAQQLPDDRHIADQRVQGVSGRDGALQFQPVAIDVDPAIGSDPERLAEDQQMLDRHAASAVLEIAPQVLNGRPEPDSMLAKPVRDGNASIRAMTGAPTIV